MKRFATRCAMVLSLAAIATPAAAADWSWSGCGGTTFTSCATVTITLSGNFLDLYVSHDAGSLAGTRLGVIGLANVGGTGVSGARTAGTGNPTWSGGANNSLKVNGYTPYAMQEGGSSPKGLFVGQNVTFRFTKTGGSWNLGDAYFVAHAQGGPTSPVDCGSSKLLVDVGANNTGVVVDSKGSALQAPAYSTNECIPPPPVVETAVPEPATMVLLATGLLGLGAVQVRRRKKER